MTTQILKFGNGNAKLDQAIFTFSLPATHSCPGARECKVRADRHTGKIKGGPDTQFWCYATMMEMRHRTVRNARWHNFDLVRGKAKSKVIDTILCSLTPFAGYVRVHDSGDFFSQTYFDAWMEVARQRRRTLFYAYTKSLVYWVARVGTVPDNFVLTASWGGTHDHLIDEYDLRSARMVLNKEEAERLGLEIDHDDSHAMMNPGPDFALLIHGPQPAGTPASKAVAALRAQGEYGYGKRADAIREQKRTPLTVAV